MPPALLPEIKQIQEWLIGRLSERLGVPPQTIDVNERLGRYGVDSIGASLLLAELGVVLGRPLSPTLIWRYPSIAALAHFLATGASAAPSRLSIYNTYSAGQSRNGFRDEPVAIIGMACRFPKAPSLEAYWRLLCGGVDAISEVPRDRWEVDAFYEADLSAPGKMTTRWGGFLDHVDGFDPRFFDISPREASAMDPQQRLMLELSWEALEDAGIPPRGLTGSRTGVFFGAMWADYARLGQLPVEHIVQHSATGQDLSIIPARVSYVLGLQGPSLQVNTACSSSLVAVHLACQSLLRGESRLALAGGVSLILSPEATIAMSKFGGMAPDGRSKAFDARANGYVRGEGGGVVVLKLLSRARADGDRIDCVIRGSAVNNDGFSNGLSAPNGKAQEAVLREAYRRAGVAPTDVHYVEAHGTGTMLGDPIEAKALGAVLCADRQPETPLRIGSVKTNIGHLEPAAGISGLIKVALSMRHATLLPSIHFQTPNPHIPFDDLRLRVQQSLEPWPVGPDGRLLAGVSSFGFGGTNSHVVIEGVRPTVVHVLPLSAPSADALRTLAQELLTKLDTIREQVPSLPMLCSLAAARLSQHEHRLALTLSSYDDLPPLLNDFVERRGFSGLSSGKKSDKTPRVAFMFGGHGSQWLGMGSDLLHEEPVFRAALMECQAAMREYVSWSLIDVLTTGDQEASDMPSVVQPTIFAVQVALAALWRSWGVEPEAVVGQSIGEIAAAHVAGALGLDEAAKVICTMAGLVNSVSGIGGAAVVDLAAADAQRALAGFEERVCVAGSIGPTSTVLAGDTAGLEELLISLQEQAVLTRRIRMNYAPHSPHVDSLRGELWNAIEGLRPRPCKTRFYSTITGEPLDGVRLDAGYWVRNLREPFLFSKAIERMCADGLDVFIDVSPHPILVSPVERSIAALGGKATVLSSLRRDDSGGEIMRRSLCDIYVRGGRVAWHRLVPPIEPSAEPILAQLGAHEATAPGAPALPAPPEMLTLSARSSDALEALARSMSSWMRAGHDGTLSDLCYAANVRRSHLEHRVAVVGRSLTEMAESLDAFVGGDVRAGVAHGDVQVGLDPKLVFVFPGQGSQWLGMGRELLEREPVFRAAIEACDEAIQRESSWSLLQELAAGEGKSRLDQIDVIQPTLFAIAVALSALWRSWGVEPDAVVGHSMGEVAAAHVAGVLPLDDAAQIICRRSRLLRRVSGQGAMALVELPMDRAAEALHGFEDRVSIAVSNSPRSTVLSGEPQAIEQILAALEQRKIFVRRVKVDVASHSPQMDPLLDDLRAMLSDVRPMAAQIPFHSTVKGKICTGRELGPSYWLHNLREPVLFSVVIQRLVESGHSLFVEMSPHPILVPAVEEMLRNNELRGAALSSLRRGQEERRALLESLAVLHTRGRRMDFARIYPSGRCVVLPAYPWQRERCWIEQAGAAAGPSRRRLATGNGATEHPLLGASLSSSLQPKTRFWEQVLSTDAPPYLSDHRVLSHVVLPGAAYIEMALAAAVEALRIDRPSLANVAFERMLIVPDEGQCTVQLVFSEDEAGRSWFQISSREGDTWVRHARGEVVAGDGGLDPHRARELPQQIQARCAKIVDAAEHYELMAAHGLPYGVKFQGLERLWVGADEALGRVRLPEDVDSAGGSWLHPALLDGCIQTLGWLVVTAAGSHGGSEPYVPASVEGIRAERRAGRQVWAHARLRRPAGGGAGHPIGDVLLVGDDGMVVADVRGLGWQRLSPSAVARREPLEDWLYTIAWQRRGPMKEPAAPHDRPRAPGGAWLVLADRSGIGAELDSMLKKRGDGCVRVVVGDRFARVEPSLYELDPLDKTGYHRLLDEAFSDGKSCLGVVHCWSLDATPVQGMNTETLRADQRLGSLSALHVAQALTQKAWRDPPRIWLVTRGSQAAGAERHRVSLAQAPLWGFARTLLLEHPALPCICVDLSAERSTSNAEALFRELFAADGEDQVALRPDGRYVARLTRSSFAAVGGAPTRVDRSPMGAGSCLITGGLGGLGLSVAAWLVSVGARHVALMGRSAPTEAARHAIAAMEQAGAEVLVVQGDVSKPADVASALGEIAKRLPPLRGIVHAAGILDDRTVMDLDPERFDRVMAPKVQGAWNLHAQTLDLPLDFFVLYSSVVSLLGSPGQSNYAAANAFLDALAHDRRAMDLPAASINWGPFSEVGLAAANDHRGARLAGRGIASLTPAQGIDALGRLLTPGTAQIGVLSLELRQWIEFYPSAARAPFLAELRKMREQEKPAARGASRIREGLLRAKPAERSSLLGKHVAEHLGRVVRRDPSQLDRQAAFTAMGMDSLMSLELRNRLESSLGLTLPATLLFTYPNVASLTEFLLGKLELPTSTQEESPPPSPQAAPTSVVAQEVFRTGIAPIAILGAGCRFPGGATDPASFWRLLEAAVDAVTEVPAARWPLSPLAQGEAEPAARAVRWGAFLESIDQFDPQFFGIAPREAASLDPQQRLLLEVAWEALENAGQVPERLVGATAGVFLGMMTDDYAQLSRVLDADRQDVYTTTGNGHCFAAGRLSYTLGLQGPSLTVDTACSSSLVAIHLACQSLRNGESALALAGGVNLMISPLTTQLIAKTGALSPDGRCRAFDAQANGFVRGEGCGLVVLKRLADAERDGDPILALIRASAVNQDGRSTGLTAPNVLSQQAMLRRVLEDAGVAAEDVGYIEAHGTGTSLGDPIEVDALVDVFGKPRADGSACVLGAVKTNIGHLEAAAGVAGVIKVVLSLQRQAIPGNLHFRTLNPRIRLEGTPFVIPTTKMDWPSRGRPRLAGVSSFGMSGTNAHVLLEEAPRSAARGDAAEQSAYLLPLSAKSADGLIALAKAYRERLTTASDARLHDIAYTASVRRGHHEERLAVAGASKEEIAAVLDAFLHGDSSAQVAQGKAIAGVAPKVVFVFSGQGSQWVGMGRALLDDQPVFRRTIEACDALIQQQAGWSLIDELMRSEDTSRLGETEVAQPALFSLEVALVELFASFGVVPDAVLGHSIGEIAAAHVAGALTLQEAVRLVLLRGRVMQKATGQGKMVAVALSEEHARREIAGREDLLDVAAVNDPGSAVLAGDAAALDAVVAELSARGVRCRPLQVSYAFHSPAMESLRAELVAALGPVSRRPASLPIFSTVTGGALAGEALDAAYWGSNIRKTVRFAQAVEAALDEGAQVFVEMGPHPVLTSNVERCISARGAAGHALYTLRRQKSERLCLLQSLGGLFACGVGVTLSRLFPEGGRTVAVPTYPWQRRRYWLDVGAATSARPRGQAGHPLLGAPIPVAGTSAVFEVELRPASSPVLSDHRIHGEVLVPAAALLEMARAAAEAQLKRAAIQISGFLIKEALPLSEGAPRQVQTVLSSTAEGRATVGVYSRPSGSPPDATWTQHASGDAQSIIDDLGPPAMDVQSIRARCTTELSIPDLYEALADRGLSFGPSLRALRAFWKGANEAVAHVELPATALQGVDDYGVHPTLLDAALQTAFVALDAKDGIYLPFELGEVVFCKPLVTGGWVYARMDDPTSRGGEIVSAAVTFLDEDGDVVFEISSLRMKRAAEAAISRRLTSKASSQALLVPVWEERALPVRQASVLGRWLLLASGDDSAELAQALRARLELEGAQATVAALDARAGTDAIAASLAGGAAASGAPLQGVVCLWEAGASAAPAELAERLSNAGLTLVQELLKHASPSRLVWVTRGAQAVRGGAHVALPAASLWGLGRVVMLEHPELQCRLVDLEPGPGNWADVLLRELQSSDDEAQAAWRGGERFVMRLVEAKGGEDAAARQRAAGGAVLITGGLGALGLAVAAWLWEEHKVGELVLVGRNPPDAQRLRSVERLRARGVAVTVVQADVASAEDVARVVSSLPPARPLRGIIHAAGVLDDGVLAQQDAGRFAAVFGPKARGAWNLHHATRHMALDFFVMFSSVASLLGSAGQSSYAAANAFMDALAHERRAEALVAQSFHWGAWAGGGMAERLDTTQRARWSKLGFGMLPPSRALALMAQAMEHGDPELAILPLDLERLRRSFGSEVPPVWRALVEPPSTTRQPAALTAWVQGVAGLTGSAQTAEVMAAVRADIAKVLGLPSPNDVPESRPLSELGMDSLMAVELRNALAARVARPLPATLAFDYVTLGALTRYLLEQVLSAEEPRTLSGPSTRRQPRDESIAIIGIGCRYPGGVTDVASFWRLVEQGIDAMREVPRDRWDIDAYYDPNPDTPGKMITRSGGFLDGVDAFDPGFFGISPREAAKMDPQQRVLLEVAWEALDHAGLPVERLTDTNTGVFVGLMYHDYAALLGGALDQLDGYVGTGSAGSVASGRISYLLGVKGPSMTVDTACSSSLVTLHLACQSLRAGECSVALAGGVTLMLTPAVHVEFSRLRGLAPDGRCKSFDAAADGVAWSEGCGMLVLKRVTDAERDGDTILAIIRGSAVNQDGRSNGLTAPNGPSQEDVIRRACSQARISPSDVGYVEAHGTGTQLGDPIEAQALGAVMRVGRSPDRPLVIGSVKSNFGHTQAAAGVAGVIKAALALQHGIIPRTLHCSAPNPQIAWSDLQLKTAAEPIAWPALGGRRIAGVSSFGISGTNAHVVLEAAPAAAARAPEPAADEPVVLLPISAKSPEALRAFARDYREFLGSAVTGDADEAVDIAYTASVRRSQYEHRLAVIGSSRTELSEALDTFLRSGSHSAAVQGHVQAGPKPKVVFVFPGQGSQWLGMARELLREEPVFRAAIDACDKAIQREAGWSLNEELAADERRSRLAQIDIVQPTLFATAVALSVLWRSWGLEPDAVVGHSMGEVGAAHVAGALSLEDAAAIICRRSRLLRRVSGQGAMALVELPMDRAAEVLHGYEDRVSIAVTNSPRSTVLSGDPRAIEEILSGLEQQQIFCRRVKVDVASHSPQMDPLLDELRAKLVDLSPGQLRVPLWSTVTGQPCAADELVAAYWARNLRDPVLFSVVAAQLIESGPTFFVELSPHPILVPALEELLRDSPQGGVAVGSLRRYQPERQALIEAASVLYARGQALNFRHLHRAGGRHVALPSYPWQRQRYWLEHIAVPPSSQVRFRRASTGAPSHPLLGMPLSLSMQAKLRFWEQDLSTDDLPYLSDHRLYDEVVLPGAAYVEMALSSVAQALNAGQATLFDVRFERLLAVPTGSARPVQVALRDAEGGRASFQVSSLEGATWLKHATGQLSIEEEREPATDVGAAAPEQKTLSSSLEEAKARCASALGSSEHYARMTALGVHYGARFQGVETLWIGSREAVGWVRLPDGVSDEAGTYVIHPVLLDSCFQVLGGLLADAERQPLGGGPFVPTGIERLRVLRRSGRQIWVHARVRSEPGVGERIGDLTLMQEDGQVVMEIEGLRAQRLERRRADGGDPRDAWLYTIDWQRRTSTSAPREGVSSTTRATVSRSAGKSAWLVLMDRDGTGAALATSLSMRGEACVRVVPGARFARIEPGLYQLDPLDPKGYARMLDDAFGGDGRCRGVIHLWSLDAAVVDATTGQTLQDDQAKGCLSVLYLAQALLRKAWRDAPRLWLVTRGAQAIGDAVERVAVAQAPVLGLHRTLMIEHPALLSTCVDLNPTRRPAEAQALFDELWATEEEDQIALRADGRYVARLARGRLGTAAPSSSSGAAEPPVVADASYLVTGGLGGLGLSVAGWLVARGARHVAIMGRSVPGAPARAAIAAMEAAGAEVVLLKADVGARDDVEKALATIERQMPPLRGIVHAAGVLDDGVLLELDAERFRTVLSPKMHGAWNLHELTLGKPLDFFVLYSSAASLLGSPGQANYAAANAFLDALAHHRRATGLPALSINWGAFSEVGLAAAQQNRGARLAGRGMESLTPDQGNDVLGALLLSHPPQIGVMALNARQWLEFYPSAARSGFWADLREERTPGAPPAEDAARFREALASAKPDERSQLMEGCVRKQLGLVLRVDWARIDRHALFRDMGVDSLMSLEVRNRLESVLALKLPAGLLFTYPDLAALAEHLLSRLDPRASAPAAPPVEERVRSIADEQKTLESLTQSELLGVLEEELALLGKGSAS